MSTNAKRTPRIVTGVAILVYIALFILLTFERHNSYNSAGFDLGTYDQMLWQISHGNLIGFLTPSFRAAPHFEPILTLLAPLRAVFADVRWLLVLQTVGLGIAGIAVYRIANREWQNAWAGAFFTILYLIYLPVGWVNISDFHPLALATPLLFLAFDMAETKQYRLTSVLLLLGLFCKEEMGLVVAFFGLYWFFRSRWRSGLVWGIVGLVWFLVTFFVILPGAPQGRYGWLSQPLGAMVSIFITMFRERGFRFLVQLFIPFAFIPLLRPGILMIASPIFAAHLLSSVPAQTSVYYQYMANIIPFVVIAAIKGSHDVWQWAERLTLIHPITVRRALIILLTVGSLLTFILFNPFLQLETFHSKLGASLAGLNAVGAEISPDECLITANNIASHYSQRPQIYILGGWHPPECKTALLDAADYRFQLFGFPQEGACEVFEKEGFNPVFYQDNVVLLRQNITPVPAFSAQFANYCNDFRRRLAVSTDNK
jgi:uncharacterized membrane protein